MGGAAVHLQRSSKQHLQCSFVLILLSPAMLLPPLPHSNCWPSFQSLVCEHIICGVIVLSASTIAGGGGGGQKEEGLEACSSLESYFLSISNEFTYCTYLLLVHPPSDPSICIMRQELMQLTQGARYRTLHRPSGGAPTVFRKAATSYVSMSHPTLSPSDKQRATPPGSGDFSN